MSCAEVNARTHSETRAIPDVSVFEERPLFGRLPSLRRGEWRKVDKLSTVRFGSARYSVPRELVGRKVEVIASDGHVTVEHDSGVVARHTLVAPARCR